MTVKDLAEDVPQANSSTISKIRNGDFARISDARLDAIIGALVPRDPIAQCEIVCAYLEDICPKAYRHRLRIEPRVAGAERNSGRQNNIHELLELLAQAAAKDEAFMLHLQSLKALADAVIKT